jgi:hypothetical protein
MVSSTTHVCYATIPIGYVNCFFKWAALRGAICDKEDRGSEPEEEKMSAWKNTLVVLTMIFLGVAFLIFLLTGYTALY